MIEAKATIQGPSDYYVKIGSSVNLVCAVSQGPHELGSIYWQKGNGFEIKLSMMALSISE